MEINLNADQRQPDAWRALYICMLPGPWLRAGWIHEQLLTAQRDGLLPQSAVLLYPRAHVARIVRPQYAVTVAVDRLATGRREIVRVVKLEDRSLRDTYSISRNDAQYHCTRRRAETVNDHVFAGRPKCVIFC
jgi:hypothetical protein